MKHLFLSIVLVFGTAAAHAGDLEWNGNYRIEGVTVKNPEMGDVERNKAYILHHLTLSPKIAAYDGLTIQGRFDILNSAAYPNSQMGQFFGSGVGTPGGTTADNSNVLSDRQASDTIQVSELYLTYAHEFGVLTAGRAPLQFGLGMSYNAGEGPFDHWFDTRDLVAYKMSTGNLTFTPAFGKVVENDPGFGDDIDDYMFTLMYENPETDLKLGVMYRQRHAGRHGNDIPGAPVFGDGASVSPQGAAPFKGEYWNIFFQRWIGDSFKIGVEIASQKGKTGVTSAAGEVELDAYGAALEMDWIPKTSSWNFGMKAGVASGDDPSTPSSYEGFQFDRNYDVAFIMFNHPVGQYDIFRTAANRVVPATTIQQLPASRADEETISNVLYLAPNMKYKWNDKFDTQLGLTYARLNSDPVLGRSVDKSVGFEVDISATYKPFQNVLWVNRVGILAPGPAFEAGGQFPNPKTTYGLETKAAITF